MLQWRRTAVAILLACCSLVLSQTTSAQPAAITVAAASDLQGVLPEIAARFEQQSGVKSTLTFGSSGTFFAQIQNGAPFDLFLSADIDYPRRLEQAGLAAPGTLYQYATGQIVLWTATRNQALIGGGLTGLTSTRVRRIAIANPEHAPYGRAAVAALKSAGIYEQVRGKLVLGENVSQAAQFVHSGNADVGIIARSIVTMPRIAADGVAIDIPPASYPAIAQAAVVMKAARNQDAARRFLAFMRTAAPVDLLRRFGFAPPTDR
jgi:molybdate transport system substrate-binding protein